MLARICDLPHLPRLTVSDTDTFRTPITVETCSQLFHAGAWLCLLGTAVTEGEHSTISRIGWLVDT
jgi:hypothetical protein